MEAALALVAPQLSWADRTALMLTCHTVYYAIAPVVYNSTQLLPLAKAHTLLTERLPGHNACTQVLHLVEDGSDVSLAWFLNALHLKMRVLCDIWLDDTYLVLLDSRCERLCAYHEARLATFPPHTRVQLVNGDRPMGLAYQQLTHVMEQGRLQWIM